jgi:hypothetical protein
MTKAHLRGALLAGLIVGAVAFAPVAQAQGPRVLIVELDSVTLPAPHDKTSLASELGSALTSAGCQVVRVCHALDCQVAPSKDVNVLSFSGRYEPSRFTCSLTVELRRAGGTDSRWSSENPVCPAVQLVKDTREAGRRACDELRAGPSRTAARAAAGEGGPRPTATGLAATAASDPASSWPARRWVGVGAVVAGLGVGALGVFQVMENGDPTRCSTSSLGDTVCTGTKRRPLAIPLIALGAAGVGWGLWEALGFGVEHNDGLTMVTARGRF